MRVRLVLSLLTLFCSAPLLAENASVDPCRGTKVENQWLLTINEQDAASRENLLETLRLLAAPGFSVKQVFSFSAPSLLIVMKFDPLYSSEPGASSRLKEDTLAALLAIPGTRLECDGIATINPAIGVRPLEENEL